MVAVAVTGEKLMRVSRQTGRDITHTLAECSPVRGVASPGYRFVMMGAVGLLKRKTEEEKASARADKEARKAEILAKWDAARAERQAVKTTQREARIDKIRALLAADEMIEADFTTAELMMKKDAVFTTKRLLIAPAVPGGAIESIPYRSITAFRSENFITKNVLIEAQGQRDSLELAFDQEADRDRAIEVLNNYAL